MRQDKTWSEMTLQTKTHLVLEKEPAMARAPNYDQERKERDRLKAAKKAEKLAAKAAKERPKPSDETESDTAE